LLVSLVNSYAPSDKENSNRSEMRRKDFNEQSGKAQETVDENVSETGVFACFSAILCVPLGVFTDFSKLLHNVKIPENIALCVIVVILVILFYLFILHFGNGMTP